MFENGLFILFIMTLLFYKSMVSMITTLSTHRFTDSHSSLHLQRCDLGLIVGPFSFTENSGVYKKKAVAFMLS